jgi:hypothetical protein
MKLFSCQNCFNLLYFENSLCGKCGFTVGYLPGLEVLSAVAPDGGAWIALADPHQRYRFCANWEKLACNWMVRTEEASTFCTACQHNRTIPDVTDPIRHGQWVRMETAKRRLFYSLLRLRLPLPLPGSGDQQPLAFDFLDDLPGLKVTTGHDEGTITVSLIEADDAERERLRTGMGEPYRTLLGHFRHEIGHFYWDKLVRDGGLIEGCRAVFGDESVSYDEALKRYYREGPAPDWPERFISGYATMHPWEDFAETWAHYLHIVDTLEMAYAFGITVAPRVSGDKGLSATIDRNPYNAGSVVELVSAWLPITFAVNSLNRTMGLPDLYPFIISPAVVRKLEYIRALVQNSGGR